ncbi:unnamed protein product [Ectocarpus sp. CCAP 1310/34]|nr:unnamed protein product [Ectocarpus sp. CCAP 1310/34]
MGEPIIASITCGSIAVVMLLWNWRMYELQKTRGKACAKACAREAQLRLKARAEEAAAVAAAAAAAAAEAAGASLAAAPPAATCVSTQAPSKSPAICPSRVIKLESLPECNESTSQSQDKQSPLLLVTKPRERLETAPLSPPLSSTRSRSGTGCFFTDE